MLLDTSRVTKKQNDFCLINLKRLKLIEVSHADSFDCAEYYGGSSFWGATHVLGVRPDSIVS